MKLTENRVCRLFNKNTGRCQLVRGCKTTDAWSMDHDKDGAFTRSSEGDPNTGLNSEGHNVAKFLVN